MAPHPEQVAAGSGTAQSIPVTPEIRIHGDSNLFGIVALTDHRLIVSHHADGLLYRIDLDANGGRTIMPISGTVVPLANGVALDGNRLIVADVAGLSVVALDDDAGSATLVNQIRDPSAKAALVWDGRVPSRTWP